MKIFETQKQLLRKIEQLERENAILKKACSSNNVPNFVNSELKEKNRDIEAIKSKLNNHIQDLKLKNKELEESKNRLELALEKTNTGFFDWFPHEDKAFFSKTRVNMLGYDQGDINPNLAVWKELIHPDDRKVMLDTLNNIVNENGDPPSPEIRFRTKDGRYKWFLVRGAPVEKDKDGRILRIVGIHTDITQRKLDEEALKEKHDELLATEEELQATNEELHEMNLSLQKSEEQLITIIENSPVIIILIDEERRITKINTTGLVAVNKPLKKVVGTRVGDVFSCAKIFDKGIECGHSKNCKDCKLRNIVSNTFETKRSHHKVEIDLSIIRRGKTINQTYLISTSIIVDEDQIKVLISLDDITRRKAIEEEIKRNKERLESQIKISQFATESSSELFDFAINEAVLLTDSSFGFIFTYDCSSKLLIPHLRTEKSKDNKKIASIATCNEVLNTGWIQKIIKQNQPSFFNNLVLKDSSNKIRNCLIIPVYNNQEMVAIAGVSNNKNDFTQSDEKQLSLLMNNVWKIVARLNTYKELIVAKEKAEAADRLKTAFLNNMSHEIRTPMNGIVGFSELLTLPGLDEDTLTNYVGIINRCSNQLLSTVEDIIKISTLDAHQEVIQEEELCVNGLLKEFLILYKTQANKKKLTLQIRKLPEEINSHIYTDTTKLRQILMNLIGNALKFTPKGFIEFGCILKGGNLIFHVKDTGIGMKPEVLDKIFERFWQVETNRSSDFGGLGLGLSISKAFINLFGGKIWVESEYGKGTTFYFTLPYNSVKM